MRHILVAFVLILLRVTALAQSGVEPAGVPPSAVVTAAPVSKLVLFSRPVFGFRASLLGVSASDRAKRAHARIDALLELPGPHVVSVRSDPVGMEIQINGATSFVVTRADLDPAREETLEQAAQRAGSALDKAIRESAESRSLETLTRALALALAGTALYGALIWLAAHGRQALVRQLVALTQRHTTELRVGGVALLHRDRMSKLVQLALRLAYHVLVLLLTVE